MVAVYDIPCTGLLFVVVVIVDVVVVLSTLLVVVVTTTLHWESFYWHSAWVSFSESWLRNQEVFKCVCMGTKSWTSLLSQDSCVKCDQTAYVAAWPSHISTYRQLVLNIDGVDDITTNNKQSKTNNYKQQQASKQPTHQTNMPTNK